MTGALLLLLLAAAPDLGDWWVEGGERVWVEGDRIHVKADAPGKNMATVWQRKTHPADFQFDAKVQVILSSKDVNNINLFFSYAGPEGKGLEQTAGERASGQYGLYHKLPGYSVTFVNEAGRARIRIRKNPGFRLLAEAYTYHCRAGVTYELQLIKRGGDIRFFVDGEERLRASDPEPLGGGHLGLRTFSTYLWWKDVEVRPLN
jgi:hypothetical protein